MVELVVFDLDGTLVDSVRDIAAAARVALLELDLWTQGEIVDEAFVSLTNDTLGYGLNHTIEALIEIKAQKHDKKIDADKKAHAMSKGYRYYLENPSRNTRIFDGVMEMLEAISRLGIKLAILSNKDHDIVERVVADLFSTIEWYAVRGAMSGKKKKPHPESLLDISQGMSSMMVGDMDPDVEVAMRAGVPFVGAGWGYYEARLKAKEHWVFHTPQDFVAFLRSR